MSECTCWLMGLARRCRFRRGRGGGGFPRRGGGWRMRWRGGAGRRGGVGSRVYTWGAGGGRRGGGVTQGGRGGCVGGRGPRGGLGEPGRYALLQGMGTDLGNTAVFGALASGGALLVADA